MMLLRSARTLTTVFICAVTLFGVSATAAADPTENGNTDKLFALLSAGYQPTDCKASKLYPEDPFLARLGCGPNGQPDGPVSAIYSLYANAADLNRTFTGYVNSGTPVPCPGTTNPGPTPWAAGMVLCATSNQQPDQGAPALTWTKDTDLLVVTAKPKSRDLAALYGWWLTAR